MTRKSKREQLYSDSEEDLDLIVLDTEQPVSPVRQNRDYFDIMCNIYDEIMDYCTENSLFLLDHNQFENFSNLIYEFIPETNTDYE